MSNGFFFIKIIDYILSEANSAGQTTSVLMSCVAPLAPNGLPLVSLTIANLADEELLGGSARDKNYNMYSDYPNVGQLIKL